MESLRDVFEPALLRQVEQTIEKWLPRRLDSQSYEELSPCQQYQVDIDGINKAIFEPIWDLIDRGGKRWRAVFMILIAQALGHTAEEIMDFVVLPEIFHNGSLIIDDIEDDSGVRRGKPCIHLLTGLDIAINAGNALYFLPLRILKSKRDTVSESILLKCYEIYSQEMTNAHFGQGLDILWHSKHGITERNEPTVENYLYMCANKTGAVVKMCAKLSVLICNGTEKQMEALSQFVEAIGIAFQIQDDILNVTYSEDNLLSVNKGGVGEDIHEGKRTLMVIHCLNNAKSQRERLRTILDMKTFDKELIKEAIDILNSTNSIQFAREKAQELVKNAWTEVDKILEESAAKK